MVFLVNFLILLEHLSQIVDIVFQVSSLGSIFTMEISVTSLVFDFFLDVLLMESNHTSLKLLEISDMMKAFEHIIFELLLETLLFIKLCSEILDFVSQTFLSHSQIINNQSQVLVDSIEMSQFLSHLVCLLIQLLDIKLSWTNVSLQFFDFVIQYELELFKLLCLLFQVNDSMILILNGGISLFELTYLTLNVLLKVSCILNKE
jgi:hypothetical protein